MCFAIGVICAIVCLGVFLWGFGWIDSREKKKGDGDKRGSYAWVVLGGLIAFPLLFALIVKSFGCTSFFGDDSGCDVDYSRPSIPSVTCE